MKIFTVIGARPQFIKASVVSRALARAGAEEILVHTGQHYDANMSDVFFEELEIPKPSLHLGIGGASHGAMTGRMLEALEQGMLEARPDWVLIYGDTNSTLAGALAAAKLHIPVAHVEAGLRSFNRRMPEEINRVVADHVSTLLLAPNEVAVKNLISEGITGDKVRMVGDVMYDAALFYGERASKGSRILEDLGIVPGAYVLSTIHRAENTDDPVRLQAIMQALESVASQLPVILPLHPRTRGLLPKIGFLPDASRIRIIDPVGYLDMVMLERQARLIATDSGGVQKEAFFYRVPCVTLRDETEWVELVELGWNQVVSPRNAETVTAAILGSLDRRGLEGSPYGDGTSAQKIVEILAAAV